MRVEPNNMQGWNCYSGVAAGSGDAASISSIPGVVGGYDIHNKSAAAVYVKLYDLAAAPSAGATSGIVMRIGIPAATSVRLSLSPCGVAFSKGIGITIVTTNVDNGSTGVTAADCIFNIFWLPTPRTA